MMFLILQMKMPPILKGAGLSPPHRGRWCWLAAHRPGQCWVGCESFLITGAGCHLPWASGKVLSVLETREEIQNVGMELTPCPPVRHAPDFKDASLSSFPTLHTILTWKGRKKKHLKCFETFLFLGFLFSDHVTS